MNKSRPASPNDPQGGVSSKRRKLTASPPQYEFPKLPAAGFALALLFMIKRSFVKDSQTVANFNDYPRRFLGIENVPENGRFLLTANHYARPGLQPYHWAMIATAELAKRRPTNSHIYWVFTSEWHGRHFGRLPLPAIVFRWLFSKIAKVHDLVTIPVTPDAMMRRAATMRKLFHLARRGPIGITPEGDGIGVLQKPPQGSGLLLYALNRSGLPILPLAVWEENGELVYNFGSLFDLTLPEEAPRHEQDALAQEQIMTAIGNLLPPAYQGEYAAAVSAIGGGSE